MPLLMKEPEQGPLPDEAEIEIGADLAGAVVARRGQLLTITDVEGRQPAALFGVTLANPREFLSPHHTRVFSNSFMLRLGMRLVTNRRRPILVLGRDTVDSNDLLFPAVDSDYLARHGQPGRAGAAENALQAFADAGIEPPKWNRRAANCPRSRRHGGTAPHRAHHAEVRNAKTQHTP